MGAREDHQTFCRICAAACGLIVSTDSERVIGVRGDPDHPASRGYTCTKGRALGAWHHRADRLDTPVVRGDVVTWPVLLDDLGTALGDLRSAHGADSIAMYLATGFAYDSAAQVSSAMWLGAIGSSSFYTAATIDNAPVLVAAELVAGHPMLNPVWDPASPGVVVFVGSNPVVSHGYGTTLPDPVRRLRDYRRAGGRVWVLDPQRTETAALADQHLALRPGSDVEVLAYVARELLAEADAVPHTRTVDLAVLRDSLAPFTIERAAAASGLEPSALIGLVGAVHSAHGRVAMFCGTGVTMARDGVVAEWLRWVILALTASLDVDGGMRFNRGLVNRLRPPRSDAPARALGPQSRPDLPRVAGQMPCVALVDEIEAGNVRALVVAGGNPLTAFPEPDRVRRALQSLDVLAVVDVAANPLTEIATHVLPAVGQLERADLALAEQVAVRSAMQSARRVVAPVAERKPVWWMFAHLAQRMGTDVLGGAHPDDLTDEAFLGGLLARSPIAADDVFAAGSHGVDIPIEFGWVTTTMLPDGCWNIAHPLLVERLAARVSPRGDQLLLIPRRHNAWSNSVHFSATVEAPTVRVSPNDATRFGIADGQPVSMRSAHGSLDVVVAIDPSISEGAVNLPHGRWPAKVGALTSSHVDVDPLTAMPLMSGVAVTLHPASDDPTAA